MSSATLSTPVLVGVGVAVLAGLALLPLRRSLPFPPGPKGLPLIGNALDLPSEYFWLKYAAWAKEYGDVVHVSALGMHIVVLNSQEAVDDLMTKRGANYSDRIIQPMMTMSGWEQNIGLSPYGDRWRKMRQLMLRMFGRSASRNHVGLQEEATRRFVHKMYADPTALYANTHWLFSYVALKMVYNYDIGDRLDDPLMSKFETALDTFNYATQPGWAVNLIPALRHLPEWFPGAGFVRQAREWKVLVDNMYNDPFRMVKEQMANGVAADSLASELLAGVDGQGVSEDDEAMIRDITGTLYASAIETTNTTLRNSYLLILANPDAQRRAQAEIDSVTGGTRPPTYADRESLPYVEALLKEILRFQPPVPVGVPHSATADDVYRGWRIPAKCIIFPNVWAILRDPQVWTEPNVFKPERFLDATALPDPRDFIFGFGRRECPGRCVADSGAFLAIAMSLASFNILPAKGQPIPEPKFSGKYVSDPLPFEYRLEVRSKQAKTWLQ